jgi:hypothetical protein
MPASPTWWAYCQGCKAPAQLQEPQLLTWQLLALLVLSLYTFLLGAAAAAAAGHAAAAAAGHGAGGVGAQGAPQMAPNVHHGGEGLADGAVPGYL